MTFRRALRRLAVLLVLGAVLTAGSPSIIRVAAGDTLWAIAHRHHTTVSLLRRLNALPNDAMIYAGELLKVPGNRSTGSRNSSARRGSHERSYTVRPGDTLSGIASAHGVSVASLIRRNHLPASGLVQIGRRLAVPGRRTAPSTPDTVNAGVRIPAATRRSTARHRAWLASHHQPGPATVRRMVARTAIRHGVDPSLALAVAYNESGFQQRVVSPVDAIGIMQVLPSTGRILGRQYGRQLNLLRAQDNVTAGVLLLRQLVSSTGSADLALAGYYQGLGSIASQGLLPQTHAYIRNVSALRARFRRG